MDLAVVDVEEERAGRGEDAVSFDHAGAEEAEEVLEPVAVAGAPSLVGEDLGAVALAAEADAVAGCVTDGLHLGAALAFAGVEGRIDVDQLDGLVCHLLKDFEVVAVDDPIHVPSSRS